MTMTWLVPATNILYFQKNFVDPSNRLNIPTASLSGFSAIPLFECLIFSSFEPMLVHKLPTMSGQTVYQLSVIPYNHFRAQTMIKIYNQCIIKAEIYFWSLIIVLCFKLVPILFLILKRSLMLQSYSNVVPHLFFVSKWSLIL